MKNTLYTKDKLFNFRPVFFMAIALCLGGAVGYVGYFYGVSAWWLLCLLPLVGTPFLFCADKRGCIKTLFAVLGLLFFFFGGLFSLQAQLRAYGRCGVYDGEYYVVGRVVEKRDYGNYCLLTLDGVHIGSEKERGKLQAYVSENDAEDVRLSDEVLLFGKVRTDVAYHNAYGFQAERIGENVRFTMSGVQSCVVTGRAFDVFAFVRERMERRAYAGMDETSAAVTMAVLTGDTSGIESGLLENIRYGGIAHIFAVSGLHVSALYAFCLLLFAKTPLKKTPALLRLGLLIGILFFYAGVCGFSASVVRACVLCLSGYVAKLLWIKTDFLDMLGGAAIVILCITPTALFEVGFQLSFAACLGIALLRLPIKNGLENVCAAVRNVFPKRRYTAEELAMLSAGDTLPPSVGERIVRACISFFSVTLSAQIFTAPLLIYAFGYTSVWSLLLNCVFVPVISVAFAYLLLFMAIACLLPVGAAGVVLYLPSVVWSALLLLFETVDFSVFTLEGVRISLPCLAAYFCGCTFLSDKWNLPKGWRFGVAAVCFLTFFGVLLAGNRQIWACAQVWQS